jgi:hypothetical protein
MENDSTLEGLQLLSSPALVDLLLCADASDSYEPKKIEITSLRDLILGDNSAFEISAGKLKLKDYLDANNKQIRSLSAGTEDGYAVNYAQVKEAVMSLAGITPATPNISEMGAFLRLSTATVSEPWGGFYLFYWCVDTNANTSLSVSGNSVVASSGATVNFDGSVANIVNIVKDSGWYGNYLHVAVRYRNIKSISPLSGTTHYAVTTPGVNDLITEHIPKVVDNPAISKGENRLYITSDPVEGVGISYVCQLLFDDAAETSITGNETGLIELSAKYPNFTYDMPMNVGKYDYVHARIISVSLLGDTAACDTVHNTVDIDANLLSDTVVSYLAARLAEKLVTADNTNLKIKV